MNLIKEPTLADSGCVECGAPLYLVGDEERPFCVSCGTITAKKYNE